MALAAAQKPGNTISERDSEQKRRGGSKESVCLSVSVYLSVCIFGHKADDSFEVGSAQLHFMTLNGVCFNPPLYWNHRTLKTTWDKVKEGLCFAWGHQYALLY